MKQLLLITAISCAFSINAFAGSTCKTCPTAPAQEQEQDTTTDAPKDTSTDQPMLAAACKECSEEVQEEKSAEEQTLLLAGGTAPTEADSTKKEDTDAEKQVEPPQLLV